MLSERERKKYKKLLLLYTPNNYNLAGAFGF